MQPLSPIKLYRSVISGHSHRVELFLSLLGLPYSAIDIDLRNGQQRSTEFLKLNPFGQVPVINDDGLVVSDSNAILVYLAMKYGDAHWLPRGAAEAAGVQRWLSVAAGDIAFGPAAARKGKCFGAPVDMEDATLRAERLFTLMDNELRARPYLTADHPTIADIAGYSYIARAPEGGISLAPYAALQDWLARIEALPRFIPMIELALITSEAA
jgi:glutathione S-transferase